MMAEHALSATPGMLIIGSGPSGAGKNSVFNEVLRLQEGKLVESVSCTTRERRPGEEEGRDYYFISREQFEDWEHKGFFLEAGGKHDDKRYGTPLRPVLEKLQQGIDVLLVIEVNGARIARERMPDALTIFIMPGGETLAEKRVQLESQLRGRGREVDEALIKRRLEIAVGEMALASDYQHVVVNAPDELGEAVRQVNDIINTARQRRQEQSTSHTGLH